MTEFIADNAWISGIFASGYLVRCLQTLLQRYKLRQAEKLRAWEKAETHRILDDLVPSEKKMATGRPTLSSLISWRERDIDEPPATAWDRAGHLVNTDEGAWLNNSYGRRRNLREWWADWMEATRPRSPDEVALEAYEAVVFESGEIYQGRHRTDGYTEHEVTCLNTHTGEYPSLRHLRQGWENNPAPVPAEVLT